MISCRLQTPTIPLFVKILLLLLLIIIENYQIDSGYKRENNLTFR